jgi:hypothetical protein
MSTKLKKSSEANIESTYENKLRQKGLINYSSSAVFLVIKNTKKQIDTQISLINHFLLKRNISEVVADIYLHNLSGELINKKSINISGPHVYSFKPIDDSENNFEGAVYIHFRSDENLFVPFCAVTVSILSQNSICSVHTYGRVLESNELGGKLDLSETVESGWTLRDSNDISSFAVFHNGDFESDVKINIEVLNKSGEIKSVNWEQFISKRETIIIFPKEKVLELVSFLDGSEGHAKVSLVGIKGVFPRMLCGNAHIINTSILDATEIQFTHTNFDFVSMSQPPATSKYGYINQPYLNNASVIIHPFSNNLKINIDGKEVLMPSKLNFFNVQGLSQLFISSKEKLPSRLVISAIGEWGEERLPSECSSGIYTEDYLKVPAHWHWGMLRSSLNPDSDCVISIFQNKFTKNLSSSCQLVFRLFDAKGELHNQNIDLSNQVISFINLNDLAPLFSRDIVGDVWYVFSGEKLEHLNIYATVSPNDLSSGFVEHAF